MSQMPTCQCRWWHNPFASHHFRERNLVGVQADLTSRKQHARDRHAGVVAAGHQAGTRHRTNGSWHRTGELHPLGRKLVELRSLHLRVAERTDVAVAHVIDKNEHDIWLGDRFGRDKPRMPNSSRHTAASAEAWNASEFSSSLNEFVGRIGVPLAAASVFLGFLEGPKRAITHFPH